MKNTEISHRCGMSDKCEFGCPLSKSDSKCAKFSDRRSCEKSIKNRTRVSARMKNREAKRGELHRQMINH